MKGWRADRRLEECNKGRMRNSGNVIEKGIY